MHSELDQETQAVHRLIDEINALDRWRDRIGRRLLAAFGVGFALALTLLAWMMNYGQHWAAPPTRAHAARK